MMKRLGLVVGLLWMTGCAHQSGRRPAEPSVTGSTTPVLSPAATDDKTKHYPPVQIVVAPQEAQLTDLSAAELFSGGQQAFRAGDNGKAALYLDRLIEWFPEAPDVSESLWMSAVVHDRMQHRLRAFERYSAVAQREGTSERGLEARFKMADAAYFLGSVDGAMEVLTDLAEGPGIPPPLRVRAQIRRAVLLTELGRLPEAEAILRPTLETIQNDLAQEDVRDGVLPSQAEYHLAEIYRRRFLDIPIDARTLSPEQLSAELERKAQALLSAQGHYLKCIRIGHAEWATASGFRVGDLYQSFHQQLVDAPLPTGMDADHATAYREELQDKLHVLLSKALHAYKKTLTAADRLGSRNPFVEQARQQVSTLEQLLQKDAPAR